MGPFATATEFCEYTGMGLPSDLGRLQAMLDYTSAEIRGFTGQVLSVVTDDEITFPSWSPSLIVLPERPVTSISSVLVDAAPVSSDDYAFTRGGHLWAIDGTAWGAATVTYTHGYAESDPDFQRIKVICIDATSRSFTLNERSASEAMGSTLMESAGYSPETFLTEGEKMRLADYDVGAMA